MWMRFSAMAAGVLTLLYLLRPAAVPRDYIQRVETGGEIEQAYLQMGQYEVQRLKIPVLQSFEAYEIFYPEALEQSDQVWPVVVLCNGTGVPASKYRPIFEHLASWGFIVIGTEDNYAWNGFSSEMCLQYLFERSEQQSSVFYQRVDLENIGIAGHSQGGVAVVTSATETDFSSLYKAAYIISPASEELSDLLDWKYDPSKLEIPVFLVAGTKVLDADLISPLEGLVSIYDQARDAPLRIMARKTGRDHDNTLYETDGYMTAWFCWLLKGDERAGTAFSGPDPEILRNPLYQDQRMDTAA